MLSSKTRLLSTVTAALFAAALLAAPSALADEASAEVSATPAASAAKLPSFRLTAAGTYRWRGSGYVLPRARLELRGAVAADLAGQRARVEILRGGHVVKKLSVKLNATKGKTVFHQAWRIGNKGSYRLRLVLSDEQRVLAGRGNTLKLKVAGTNIRQGSRGVNVRVFQAKLRSLRYVAPLNGRFDAATARAFMAYRKVTGMARNFQAGYAVARKLADGKGAFRLRYPNAGRHVEVSIRRQVMAFADRGRVLRIYHVSTGKPSTPTVRGSYRVYMKDWGTNAKGMVHSSYFIRGYAVHGYADVPTYAASHGCVRVPVPNASSIFSWIHIGTRVDTYY